MLGHLPWFTQLEVKPRAAQTLNPFNWLVLGSDLTIRRWPGVWKGNKAMTLYIHLGTEWTSQLRLPLYTPLSVSRHQLTLRKDTCGHKFEFSARGESLKGIGGWKCCFATFHL